MNNGLNELKQMIEGTVAAFPDKKKCWKAMAAIQWVLRTADGRYLQPCRSILSKNELGPKETAEVFSGRDNEEMKLRYFQAALKTDLQIEILPQSK